MRGWLRTESRGRVRKCKEKTRTRGFLRVLLCLEDELKASGEIEFLLSFTELEVPQRQEESGEGRGGPVLIVEGVHIKVTSTI